MRIALDPVPLVVGIYAHVGELLARAAERRQEGSAGTLAQRYSKGRGQSGDKEVQKLIRALHSDVKTADKLLKKTADVWKISQETDLVDLVVQTREEAEQPKAYVLLKPAEIRELLGSIIEAARAAGESADTLADLERGLASIEGKASDYLFFGFSPWGQQ